MDTEKDQNNPKKSAAETLIDEAKKRFDICEQAEKTLRSKALDDLKFRAGEQWSQQLKSQRDMDGRPCLTLNVLPARERQILNDQRQNRQAIKVSPVDDKGDPETAEIIQGIIRHIEYDSNADVAYDTAFAGAVRHGFGYIRILTEYEGPDSDSQVIKIKRVRNPFTVYLDPNSQEPDGSDAKFGFVFTTLNREEYEDEYPDSELASLDSWESIGMRAPGWIEKDGSVRIAEYYKVVSEKKKSGEGENERESEVRKVKWYKFNAVEILDQTESVLGPWVPIVPVLGDELDVDGERILEGLVRHAKDPQRMLNFMASAEVEAIALAPKAPWIAAVGQTEDFPEWQTANRVNHAVLRHKTVDAGGNQVPPPHREVAEPPIQAITQARVHFADDLMQVTGIYQAQLGARSNETTGRAILQRKQQGEISNYHYTDNLSRAIRHVGRILLAGIPKVYNEPRVMRIIGEDGSQDTVKVNQHFVEGNVKKIYDLTVGKYDVTVSSGPSYQTKRQEAAESMLNMVQAFPQVMQVAGDLFVKNLDWPGAEELAERLKKALPPQFQDNQEIPPQAQAAIAQYQQHAQALNAYAQKLEGELKQLQFEKQARVVDNQARAEIDKFKAEVQLAIAEINTKAQVLQERITFVQDLEKQLQVHAHESAMSAQEHAQQKELADQQAQNAQSQQLNDQAFQAQQAQSGSAGSQG